jgi:Predicted nucleic-acid-binding protein containing a Zn-ribbon
MSSVAKEWREIPGRYNLEGSKCCNCGKVYFPKRDFCPKCRRESIGKIENVKIAREGEIFSFSVIHEAPDRNSALKPYAVAFVKTKDDVLIAGQVADVELDKLEIGLPVRAVLRKLDADGSSGVIHYGFKFVPKY